MLLDKTWYQYNRAGNVRRIINSVEGSDLHTATRFDYAHNGTALAYVVGETWDAARSCGTYTITHAREFRYDSGRQRYLDRELDPAQMELWNYSIVGETWTDYDGDQPYGDFTLSGINVTNARSFEPGMATVDPWTSSGSANTSFYHTNQVGSTRMMSDSGGAATGDAAYTAFGERISGTNHRYGYAGAYGYQQHDDFPYMHIGARYYDPASGRFLQRDPIGIFGGSNVYGYVRNAPTGRTDPSGLMPEEGFDNMFDREAMEAMGPGGWQTLEKNAATRAAIGCVGIAVNLAYYVGPGVVTGGAARYSRAGGKAADWIWTAAGWVYFKVAPHAPAAGAAAKKAALWVSGTSIGSFFYENFVKPLM